MSILQCNNLFLWTESMAENRDEPETVLKSLSLLGITTYLLGKKTDDGNRYERKP